MLFRQLFDFDSFTYTYLIAEGVGDDSFSFYLQHESGDRIFTGDILLIRGTGRTDFQNGNPEQQYHSLFDKLYRLPGNTLVIPGHYYYGQTVSTIEEEFRHNPRLQVDSKQEYIEIMNNLNLPDPKLMDIAVPANLKCGRVD